MGHEITGSEEVQRILWLYREKYPGFNGGRFHQIVAREHGVTLSYTFVKKALQGAGLVKKGKAHGRHFQKREPRPCFGELIPVERSPHAWVALEANQRQRLIAVLDDAAEWLFYARLWPEETTEAVMTALKEVQPGLYPSAPRSLFRLRRRPRYRPGTNLLLRRITKSS
jgi:hypothetical protein